MSRPSYAGIDWASIEHALCVVDADGEILTEGPYPHTKAGIGRLIATLEERDSCRVAIERPDGILVDRMVEAGLEVFPINPAAIKATRRRYSGSGRKSDSFDAFCLAELARTDSHRLRALVPDSDETRTLRTLTRAREDMLRRKVHAVRQLRAQLENFWPGPTKVFPEIDSPVALAFLRLHPSPGDTGELDEEGMASFLREHSSRTPRPPAELLGRLRAAPTGNLGPGEAEARRMAVLGLVRSLEVNVDQVRILTRTIVEATRTHPDGAIFLSPFKGTELVIPAQLIAGFGDDRRRYPDAGVLAAKAGIVPVAHQSGDEHSAIFRRACDHRLRQAVAGLADATRRHNPWAGAIYAASRERGHNHPHALRVLGRAWLRVLWRCWQDRVPYDPERHGGLRRLEAADAEIDSRW
jgi:transposase